MRLLPDRSVAIERSFEQAWRDACDARNVGQRCQHPDQFTRSFFEVRGNNDWNPVLLFNGTHQETGKRIITSQLRVDQSVFFDAFDFFVLTAREVALSTAVMNSARFPGVSPSGALVKSGENGAVELRGHIIDGGFFENNGAITVREVIDASLKNKSLTNWKPLVIEIINDVSIGEEDLARPAHTLFPQNDNVPLALRSQTIASTPFANELVSAASGLYATRTAHGILASKMLADFAESKNGKYVQFRLCPHMNPSPPLGWLLTAQSRQAMDELLLGQNRGDFQARYANVLSVGTDLGRYLKCFGEIQQRLSKVIQLLRTPPEQTQNTANQNRSHSESVR
jgi:hypothetical protein